MAAEIDPRADWRRYADWKMGRVRSLIMSEMPDETAWPLWISGRLVRFPGDDAWAPQHAANDATFTIVDS